MPARETERSRSRFLPRKKRQVSVRATGQLDTQHAWCGLEMLRDAAPREYNAQERQQHAERARKTTASACHSCFLCVQGMRRPTDQMY